MQCTSENLENMDYLARNTVSKESKPFGPTNPAGPTSPGGPLCPWGPAFPLDPVRFLLSCPGPVNSIPSTPG